MTPCAAKWMDCWEDPHCRSTVVDGMVSGRPAASQPFRPTLMDCSPTWETHPVMLSSICPGSTPALVTASLRTSARRSTGWMSFREPPRLPIGVRTASRITASRISGMGKRLPPQPLEGPLQEVLLLELVDGGTSTRGAGALRPRHVAEHDPLRLR